MLTPWTAGLEVINLFNTVKTKHHLPRLELANVALCFMDCKPFIRGRFNWGKVMKFSPIMKLWHPQHGKYDFMIMLVADAWHSILNSYQKEAWADLCLTRCGVEYIPVTAVDEHGKNKVVKDEWGRVEYTNEIKFDDDGVPKWRVNPLDLLVYTENVLRYGPWTEPILEFKQAVDTSSQLHEEDTPPSPEPTVISQLLNKAQIEEMYANASSSDATII